MERLQGLAREVRRAGNFFFEHWGGGGWVGLPVRFIIRWIIKNRCYFPDVVMLASVSFEVLIILVLTLKF